MSDFALFNFNLRRLFIRSDRFPHAGTRITKFRVFSDLWKCVAGLRHLLP